MHDQPPYVGTMSEASGADRELMRRALELAERGWGRVQPNPLVGAVVVRDGVVVAEGYHGEFGGPHAEIVALDAAGERARGATVYVTLEPCAHTGKTPACTLAIARAGVQRVVFGAEDPHPEAKGGADWLRAAGIEVAGGVEREAARSQNAAFFHLLERGSPYVALKYGLSLDGMLAAAVGQRTTVTGRAAWAEVHRLRAGFDAVLIGAGTAFVDDPLLTVRGTVEPRVQPVRVVIDSLARLPHDSRLVRSTDLAPLWLFTSPTAPAARRAALEAAGARVFEIEPDPGGDGGVRLDAVLSRLRAEGVGSVFCEGGGRLGAALLRANAVERLYLIYAPVVFGEAGVRAFPGESPFGLSRVWKLVRTAELEDDVLLVFDRRR